MTVLRSFAALFLLATPLFAQDAAPEATRIVSVGGAVTEIIYALEEQDRIVARDTTSLYPSEALELPDVGYMRQLAPEGVLSVDPDLILAEPGAGPPETIELLSEARIPFVAVPGTYDAAGVIDRVKAVAKALGVDDKGAALAARLATEFERVAEQVAESAQKPRLLFVLTMPGGRLNVAGQKTRPDGVINMAGAVNLAQGFEGYRILSDEALVEMAPDAILMMTQDYGGEVTDDDLWSHPALKLTPAGIAKRVIRMDGDYLLSFGPRTAAAVTDLRAALIAEPGTDG